MRRASEAAAWVGAVCGAAALAWCIYEEGLREGAKRGKAQADLGHYDDGWDRGYDRGYAACRDKAIEFGVAAICGD